MHDSFSPLRIVIADDHLLLAEGVITHLKQSPHIEICAVVENGHEAIRQCRIYQPDLILLDIGMPQLDGIETARLIKQSQPDLKIIALTGSDDEVSLLKMLQAGASACLYKGSKFNLEEIINLVMQGHALMPDFILNALLDNMYLPPENLEKPSKQINFTKQEQIVLQELMQGYTNKEIAYRLDLSTSTIKVHLSSIFRKLDVQTRTEAVSLVRIHNLLNQ